MWSVLFVCISVVQKKKKNLQHIHHVADSATAVNLTVCLTSVCFKRDFFFWPLVWQSVCAHYLLLWYPTGGLNRVVGNGLFFQFALTDLAPGAVPRPASFQLYSMQVKRRMENEPVSWSVRNSARLHNSSTLQGHVITDAKS